MIVRPVWKLCARLSFQLLKVLGTDVKELQDVNDNYERTLQQGGLSSHDGM